MRRWTCAVLLSIFLLEAPLPAAARPVYRDQGAFKETACEFVDTGSALYTYTELTEDLGALSDHYPGRFTYFSAGKSVLGRDIWLAIVGNRNARKKVLIQASMHAKEHLSTLLVMKQIEYYLKNYETAAYNGRSLVDILENTALYFIPMVNPDGVCLVQQGLSSIKDEEYRIRLLEQNHYRTDFTTWKANANGVDLNLQFDARWEEIARCAAGPAPRGYKGEAFESEPEAKLLTELTRVLSFDATISYHAAGSVIFWHFHQQEPEFSRDLAIARGLAELTGYGLVGIAQSAGSKGGYKDWFIKEYRQPGFTIEIGRGLTPLPIDQFPQIWEENIFAPICLAYLISHPAPRLYHTELRIIAGLEAAACEYRTTSLANIP